MSKSKNKSGNNTAWWVIGVLALIFVVVLNVASYSNRQQASSSLQGQEAQVSFFGGFGNFFLRLFQGQSGQTEDSSPGALSKKVKTCADKEDSLHECLDCVEDLMQKCIFGGESGGDSKGYERCSEVAQIDLETDLADCNQFTGYQRERCRENVLEQYRLNGPSCARNEVVSWQCNELFDMEVFLCAQKFP